MDNNYNNKFKKYEALRKLSHSGNKGYGEDSGSAKKTQTHLYIQLMWFCKYVLCTVNAEKWMHDLCFHVERKSTISCYVFNGPCIYGL